MIRFLDTNIKRYTNSQRGATLLTLSIVITFVSLLVLSSQASSVVLAKRSTQLSDNSWQTWYGAESGLEDVLYRLKNGMTVDTNESLNVGDVTTSTTITDLTSSTKQISTEGMLDDVYRTVQIVVETGVGAAFNYGVQSGAGGFILDNNAGVIGNVYANGSVTGGSGSFVTGSVFAANAGGALTLDQENTSTSLPSNEILFAKQNSNEDYAQSFQVDTTDVINKVGLYLRKVGNPANRTIRIVEDNSGSPGTSTLASASLSSSLVSSSYGWVEVNLATNPTLTAGTTYWLVVDGADHNSKYFYMASDNAYPSGTSKIGRYGSSWSDTTPSGLDGAFRIYMGGVPGVISGLDIGDSGVGDAAANTVNNSDIQGSLYCQSGSGNNKSCDTSQPDPEAQSFPISDANIATFKAEAEAGGTISGNVTLEESSSSLGPVRITGDLNISNGSELEITGTIWVEGDVTMDNNVVVNLASGYGSGSGVIITDGQVSLSNNTDFSGSGDAGSFVMLLSTSTCDGTSCGGGHAITISNNVGTVILYAQDGSIFFSNNAGAKAVTAYLIYLDNNATVTYDSGLVNTNFTSGPSGGWVIDSWQEVE